MIVAESTPPRPDTVLHGARFVAPATAALLEAREALRAAVEADAPVAPLREAAWRAGDAWIETILDGLILAVAAASRGPGSGRRTAATVRDLADRVVGQGVRRADRARFRAFVAFLDAHVAEAGGRPAITFGLDDAMAAAVAPVVAALHGGGAVEGPALARALRATIDGALVRLLDEPLALLGLGPFARAATWLGRGAIGNRAHAEVDRAVRIAAAARLGAWLVAALEA